MSNLAFAELETQVETLPMFQIVILKEKLEKIIAKGQEKLQPHTSQSLVESMTGIAPSLSGNYKELVSEAVAERFL